MTPQEHEQQTVQRAMAALDTMATVWAAQVNLRFAVEAFLKCPDAADRLCAFIKHAHAEGLYAGRMSHHDHPVTLAPKGPTP